MSTTKTTKFYVQVMPDEGDTWQNFDRAFTTHKEADAEVARLQPHYLNARAFRIAREIITTSFTAYQPLTNPVNVKGETDTPEEKYCFECGSEELRYVTTYANGDEYRCKICEHESVWPN